MIFVIGLFINIQEQTDVVIGLLFNRIQDWGSKRSPTSFSPVTSTNVGFSVQNLPTFNFNPFVTLVENFKVVASASPK